MVGAVTTIRNNNNNNEFCDSSQQEASTTRLTFDEVSFVVRSGSKTKAILCKVGAQITNGHVLAIMGPSGAGKTTLIHVLTQQDAYYGKAYGKVLLNDAPLDLATFQRHCYLVPQNDSNWPHLTVREILTFAAELYGMENRKVHDAVDEVITKLGLVNAAKTKSLRLSGGQQRRLSLAVALLKQRQLKVLFLDEPTSGLDAAAAAAIMREITAVAKKEKLIVICTIHQPSSKVFHDFDQIMILSKGREAYVGNSQNSIDYFASIGYPIPPATNGAEHLLDIVNADFSNDVEVDTVLETWASERRPFVSLRMENSTGSSTPSAQAIGLGKEVMISFRRNVLLVYRDPVSYLCRLIGFLVVNTFFGVVYIAARKFTQDKAVYKLWVLVWYIGVPANLAVLNVYVTNLELRAISRETKNGMGSVSAYMISKTLMSIPIMFLFSVSALGFPGYFIQDFPTASFWKLITMWAVNMYMWEASSEAMAAMFDQVVVGLLVHTAWWFCTLLFSGYLVPVEDLFWPLKILYYVTPNNFYVRSAVRLVFVNEAWVPCDDPVLSAVCVPSSSGLDVLIATKRIFAVLDPSDTYWRDVLAVFGLAICWKLMAIAIISYKTQREVAIGDPRKAPSDGLLTPARIATISASAAVKSTTSLVGSKNADHFSSSDEEASEVDF